MIAEITEAKESAYASRTERGVGLFDLISRPHTFYRFIG